VNTKTLFFCILTGILLAGCTITDQPIPTTQPATLASPVPATPTLITPSPTPVPTETLTPLSPSPTPSPTASPLPSDTPTPTVTPGPWGVVPLDSENAAGMVQRAAWGLGAPYVSAMAVASNVYVQGTPLGIYLYLADSLKLIRFLPEASNFFLSPSGDLLFTRLPDGSIQLVELPWGEIKYVFEPIAELSPGMNENVYEQIPKERPALEKIYFDEVSTINAVAISPDGMLAAIGFGDVSIGLWDMRNGELVRKLKNDFVQSVSGLIFSPDGAKLLSTGFGGEIAVWQVEDGTLLWRLPNIGHIVGQPFSPDGSHVALEITQDKSSWVSVRETRFGAEVGTQVVGSVASQAISPDNTRVVTTWYGTVKIWSIPGLRQLAKIETGLDWPRASFSTDGTYILINDGEQAYRAEDLSRDESYPTPTLHPAPEKDLQALQLMGHFSGGIGLRYPAREQAFAWGTFSDYQAWVWDLSRNIQKLYDFGSPFIAEPDLSFNADRLAACTVDGLVIIDLADQRTSNLGRCRELGVVRFSADGKTIFLGEGTLIDALDSSTGELLYNLRGHVYLVEGLAVSSDGTYLVSSSNMQRSLGRELILWQVDQPNRLLQFMVNVYSDDYLYAADIQLEDKVLYTALGGLRSWRLGDGLQDHLDTLNIGGLAISPVNHLLATGDLKGEIHIWSLDNWQELAVLSGHMSRIDALAFSPDGSDLLSLSADGTIRLWALP
jgi:WD40 repeat protein